MNKKIQRIILFAGMSCVLLFASLAQAQPDYAPANWVPLTCGKYYNSGNGHNFCVVHDMEGYYASSISYLNRCDLDSTGSYAVQASVYYCVNGLEDSTSDSTAGDITQMVRESKYAWHARCWNTYMFGTEHEGFVSNPAWYTKAMYIASSGLQRHLCDVYGIPKDRNHIIGHDEKKTASWVSWMAANWPAIDVTCNDHTDPGVYWDWNYFMDLIVKTNVLTGTYWDLNGTTTGAGSTPNGVWDNATTNWSNSPNGTAPTGIWAAIDDAVFAAGNDATNSYTVTVNGTQKVYSLRVLNANVTFNNGSSGKILFTGLGSYYSNYVAAGKTATFNVAFQGNGFPDKWGPGTAVYNNSASGTGYFSLNEGAIAVGNNSALGTNKFLLGEPTGLNPVTFKSANSTARTIGNRLVFNANNITFDTGGDLIFTNSIDLGSSASVNTTLTVNNNSIFSGDVTNTSGLIKAGAGVLTFSGAAANTFSGSITVGNGTLVLQKTFGITAIPSGGIIITNVGIVSLGAANQISDSAPMTLGGGVFNTGGLSEQLGTLKLGVNSRIDLGSGGTILKYAASSAVAWTAGATLTISNWSGSINGTGAEQLFFGNNSGGLSAGQVNQIKFVNPAGFAAGIYPAKILSTGEVVPLAVPPSFTAQPLSQNIIAGSNVTFTAATAGTSNLVYQWRFNTTNIFLATNSSLTLSNVTSDKAGNYLVVVTNIAGSITSTNAVLAIYDSAAATLNSFDFTGGAFTFNISGVPGYNYVIQTSTNLLGWDPIWTNVSPFSFIETNSVEYPSRFFRAVYQP